MRVIAGKARRTALVAPDGQNTRPTSDRAKEGLFNILAPEIRAARFLDMFCGSGAIGIEALSRGAAESVFVDNSFLAIHAVRKNLSKTKLSDSKAEIFETTAEDAIARLAAQNRRFDIIFLDPPYDSYNSESLRQIIDKLRKILAEDGVIIAETEAADLPEATQTRTYGRTKFLFINATRAQQFPIPK
ncbi:MAG: 16S rRNA (guanine(966)-N(2))-methyltransferase RsmD [Defluviitaleaceae bacterium]|nr:16S rRNA (guanine(966)-N(2))-methyltransferase RsmD [Defluviitaleaceae bacterium]